MITIRSHIRSQCFLSLVTKRLSHFLLLIVISLFSPQLVAAVQLLSMGMEDKSGEITLAFLLNRTAVSHISIPRNTDRLMIDFENTTLGFPLNQLLTRMHRSPMIQLIRGYYLNAHTLRLVFQVQHALKFNIACQNRQDGMKQKLSIRLLYQPLKAVNFRQKNRDGVQNRMTLQTQRSFAVASQKEDSHRKKLIIIVIDPGHGGKDPGAAGPQHTLEKEITLAIAYQLKNMIDRHRGMHAVLTRDMDRFVALRERLNIARKYNADLFVSIHADAFIRSKSRGVSIFTLSQRGATSEAARWLAEKENYSELGGVNLKKLDDDSGLVRTVLIDLSQTATINTSLKVGANVLNVLKKMTTLHNPHVEQARFMVLKSPDIPSILIETGFISNPQEEQRLKNRDYQIKLSRAIYQGITDYFLEYPPHHVLSSHHVASSH